MCGGGTSLVFLLLLDLHLTTALFEVAVVAVVVPDGVAFLCSFSSILYPRHSFVASDFVYLDPFLPSFTHLVADLLTETSRSLLAHM